VRARQDPHGASNGYVHQCLTPSDDCHKFAMTATVCHDGHRLPACIDQSSGSGVLCNQAVNEAMSLPVSSNIRTRSATDVIAHVCCAVCSKGYEHYYGVCIACPKGKVKNVISYGQCKCVYQLPVSIAEMTCMVHALARSQQTAQTPLSALASQLTIQFSKPPGR